uniref:Uncharacterized protein n=1 Tax=Tanacetum cinerariifolium TaxID=118510 RepID=A0A6L2J7P5_TANCI|nr:hypothetical protein [Tanacetum cinerariifolium]
MTPSSPPSTPTTAAIPPPPAPQQQRRLSPAAAATMVGCGWRIGHHRRGAVRGQTTIVVAVGRWYNHHSRTLWCWAMMAQPLVKHRGGQPSKTTTMVAAEPTLTTTAAP